MHTTSSDGQAKSPIIYAEIQRAYQSVRLGVAAGVVALATAAWVWGVSGWWLYLVAPAAAVAGQAGLHLARGARWPLTSLLADVTLLGLTVAALGDVPRTQTAALAYVMAAGLLMLSVRQAVVLAAYAGLWSAIVASAAPLTELRAAGAAAGISLDAVLGAVLLVLLAGLLVTASRLMHRLRHRQEAALAAERAASRLKDEFVSMISHEFRTPLTSIAGFVEMLTETWPNLARHEIEEFLSIIQTQTRHLSHLVEDVLVIPRLEAGRLPFEPQDFALRPVARQVLASLLPADSEAEVAVPAGAAVHADPQRVMQVLRNLVENAVKYGGDQILIEGQPAGAQYLIVVADNGPGIPGLSHDRIFEMFEQATKGDARTDRGMGLGLPIARRLVEAMGGELWLEPRFPTGARFCLTLPAAGTGDQASSPPPAGPRPQPTTVGPAST